MEIPVHNFYQNLPRLETSRLILRAMASSDGPDIFAYASDPDVTRYLRWSPHQTIRDTENYVDEVLRQYAEGLDGPWLIEHKAEHAAIGHIHLMEINVQHQKAQVGFVLLKRYWNQGLAAEALGKVLEYAFSELDLNRIEGYCITENLAAARVMEKAGMRQEGVLRESFFQKGTHCDFSVYAILRREFER